MVAGCGRYQFDRSNPDAAGLDDASSDGSIVPAPIHRYQLAGTYADDLGGPALTGKGGTLGSGGYRFVANQGLELADAMPVDIYTVDVRFAFDLVDGYRKLLDFKALATDEGLYVLNETLNFVADAASHTEFHGRALFATGTMAEVTLTRAADGTVTGYVNRGDPLTFADTGAVAAFARARHVANFGIDDTPTFPNEASGGVIRSITVWDVALTPTQVAALP